MRPSPLQAPRPWTWGKDPRPPGLPREGPAGPSGSPLPGQQQLPAALHPCARHTVAERRAGLRGTGEEDPSPGTLA